MEKYMQDAIPAQHSTGSHNALSNRLADGPTALFVYGTLRSPTVRFVVTGRMRGTEPAALPGFRRVGRDITYDPESVVEGYVLYVSTPELRRLDRYERTGQRYERVEMLLADGEPAWVYRMLPTP
jgi:gamma-glutamylcyclotransferase (GGCT)/AIG2-like uncharacterized protein YtfP